MQSNPIAAARSRPRSPLDAAQRHVKQVARRNIRLFALAVVGTIIVVTLAVLALWFATVQH